MSPAIKYIALDLGGIRNNPKGARAKSGRRCPVIVRHELRLIFAYTGSVPSHSCLVTFTDSEGIEHSVRVPAESLYEAAVEAIATFRRGVLAEMPFGPNTRLTIRVKAPEEEHTVIIAKVLSWLDGATTSPSEKLKKKSPAGPAEDVKVIGPENSCRCWRKA